MTSHSQQALSVQAQAVIDNPAFQGAFERLTERYKATWIASETVEEREELHLRVRVLQDVLNDLAEAVAFGSNDGDVSAAEGFEDDTGDGEEAEDDAI